MTEIIVGYDGQPVPSGFDIHELSSSKAGNHEQLKIFKHGKLSFVGLVLSQAKDQILLSLPKTFEPDSKQANDGQVKKSSKDWLKEAKLLLQVILQFFGEGNENVEAAELNIDQEMGSYLSYPLLSFWQVYEYYLKYGWFHQQEQESSLADHGRIDWHRTIQRAPKVFDDAGIFFGGYYRRLWSNQADFVTLCMQYVIFHTIKRFGPLLDIKYPEEMPSTLPDQMDADITVAKLSELLAATFLDRDRELLTSLIDFFQGNSVNQEYTYMVVPQFQSVWEQMVKGYLNRHLDWEKVNADNEGCPCFSPANVDQPAKFSKKTMNVNTLEKGDRQKRTGEMEPDYVYHSKSTLFIYDAKYYASNHPDLYKQLAYTLLLAANSHHLKLNCLSVALLLPVKGGQEPQSVPVFSLDHNYNPQELPIKIYETYLDVHTVMEDYVKNNDHQSPVGRLQSLTK